MSVSISENTLTFLKNLVQNNNREWFTENKRYYTESQENLIAFMETLISEMGTFDEDILKNDAKKTLFRIYRDVRFSKDKSPYKTNMGASLGMGKGSWKAGYYLHVEPGKSFLASGIYMPDSAALKAIRKEISLYSEDFLKIIHQKDFKKLFKELDQDDKLKKIPQGFEKEDPMAEYLKLKNFIVVYPLTDDQLTHKDAAKKFSEVFKTAKPLNDFLNRAIEE
ncbi:hypothetical protein ASG31_17120 [Chryseobacterium sp. Leaf404]|uniref:DUF2461 domain-containing protein n=1 Tax=unclassified Chryseobacterium TaxID=2593645 RepID=UPI0007001158|nr:MULTISPECIES: DUF2461 domain-containing protein [unclassified Chryseobacterium]KQT20897.1 hypothetical protein ASG31_17120 [Chryseobacterium sp. Leaf404]